MKSKKLILFQILFCFSNVILAQNEQLEIDAIHKATYKTRDSLGKLYQKYFAEIKSTNDSLLKINLQFEVDNLDKLTDKNNLKELENEFKFVKENLNSITSVEILRSKIRKREGMFLYEKFKSHFDGLSLKIRESKKGKDMQSQLNYFDKSRIGHPAPEFTGKDLNNNLISLSSYKNKQYILLDFWASWCAPCREDFSFLKEIYSKYKYKGLEIINISRDEIIDSWKKAIVKDKIEMWKHFSVTENKSEIENNYFVQAIPQKILIDKNGIIIGRWRSGGEENKINMRKKLEEIFANQPSQK